MEYFRLVSPSQAIPAQALSIVADGCCRIFGTASAATFAANVILGIYSLFQDNFVPQRWQIFIAYLFVTWLTCSVVLFGQRFLPYIANFVGIGVLVFGFVTMLVCAIMPSFNGHGYASHSFVWLDWNNQTGYSSNAFVFFLGMLNGAYAIGTPDGCSHRTLSLISDLSMNPLD